MPIYEYRCDHCGIIERLEQVDAVPNLVCSACNCGINKLISICAFTLDTDCPNHPDKVQSKNAERKEQLKKGTLGDWQNEHKAKFNRDRYGIGSHFSGGSKTTVSKPVRKTRGGTKDK